MKFNRPQNYLFIFLIWMACEQQTRPILELPIDLEVIEILAESQTLYGISIDSMEVTTGRIKRNQTFSEILTGFNTPNQKIHDLASISKNVYDMRRLRIGKKYTVIHAKDSLKTAHYFILEPDVRYYIVYDLRDSLAITLVDRPINVIERTIAATINSSLYESVVEAGASPFLVNRLVDILAWQIDFFRIQQGDNFKLIYEEERIGDEVIGISQISAVYFEHMKRGYYGILYNAATGEDYFDEEGNSLRKAFLRAPLDYKRISSRYSNRRYHPVQKRYKAHLGTDYAAATGTEIRSVGDGVVVEARYTKNNGNYVKIKHNGTYTTQYLHMQKIKNGIKSGVAVKQGQPIGFVGSTGLATGPHLCFRFWKNGKQVDALKVDLPPSQPINPKELPSFLREKDAIIQKLDQIAFMAIEGPIETIQGQP